MWRAIGEKAGYEIQFVQLDIAASFAEMDIDRVDAVASKSLSRFAITKLYLARPKML